MDLVTGRVTAQAMVLGMELEWVLRLGRSWPLVGWNLQWALGMVRVRVLDLGLEMGRGLVLDLGLDSVPEMGLEMGQG